MFSGGIEKASGINLLQVFLTWNMYLPGGKRSEWDNISCLQISNNGFYLEKLIKVNALVICAIIHDLNN